MLFYSQRGGAISGTFQPGEITEEQVATALAAACRGGAVSDIDTASMRAVDRGDSSGIRRVAAKCTDAATRDAATYVVTRTDDGSLNVAEFPL